MTEKERVARTAVQGLLRADKMKALAVAVLLASTSATGCMTKPQAGPCPGQPEDTPCVAASGSESGWLTQPRWPAVQEGTQGAEGQHLASSRDFVANPQYTQLRQGDSTTASSGGPRYYGGGHYFHIYSSGGGTSGGSGFSS